MLFPPPEVLMFEQELIAENAVLQSETLVDGLVTKTYSCFSTDGVLTRTVEISNPNGSWIWKDTSPYATSTTNYGSWTLMEKYPEKGEKGRLCPICGETFPESRFVTVKGRRLCIPNKCFTEVRQL
jgi:formylmethanofuran dehydrogenase subunit E